MVSLTRALAYGTLETVGKQDQVLRLTMIKHLLTTKTKRNLKRLHIKTYRGIKIAAHKIKTFFFDPNDTAPGDDFPSGPLMFQTPKR